MQVHEMCTLNKGCVFNVITLENHCFMLSEHDTKMWKIRSNEQNKNYVLMWKVCCNDLEYKGTDYQELPNHINSKERNK